MLLFFYQIIIDKKERKRSWSATCSRSTRCQISKAPAAGTLLPTEFKLKKGKISKKEKKKRKIRRKKARRSACQDTSICTSTQLPPPSSLPDPIEHRLGSVGLYESKIQCHHRFQNSNIFQFRFQFGLPFEKIITFIYLFLKKSWSVFNSKH